MACEINGTTITLTRGDSFAVELPMKVDGEKYELQDGDKCYFGMKADPEDADTVVHKKLKGYVLELEPGDTEALDFGKYWYDAYIIFANGKRWTYLKEARFVLGKESHT